MAYSGTTAGTTSQNPPILIARGLAGGIQGSTNQGTGLWFYSSNDLSSALSTGGYFSDGWQLGMRVGDVVLGVYSSSLGSTTMFVYQAAIVQASSTGANSSTAATQTSSQ